MASASHAWRLLAEPRGGNPSGNWGTHDFYHADGNPDLRYGTSTSTTSARVGVSITAMVNASGILRAYYRYNPFGRYRASGGALATANVMRFSSKPWVAFNANISDGLYYYGYRFYDPYLQRWVNRDPIGEKGAEALLGTKLRYLQQAGEILEGPNLYGFVGNNTLESIDSDGRGRYKLPPSGPPKLPPPVTPPPAKPPLWKRCWRSIGVPWTAINCVPCSAGMLQIEAQCAGWQGMGYSDYNSCVCDFYKSNWLLQKTCDNCVGTPTGGFGPSMSQLLGCGP